MTVSKNRISVLFADLMILHSQEIRQYGSFRIVRHLAANYALLCMTLLWYKWESGLITQQRSFCSDLLRSCRSVCHWSLYSASIVENVCRSGPSKFLSTCARIIYSLLSASKNYRRFKTNIRSNSPKWSSYCPKACNMSISNGSRMNNK